MSDIDRAPFHVKEGSPCTALVMRPLPVGIVE